MRLAAIAALLWLWPVMGAAQQIPRAALQYQRGLIANARVVWGLNAPIAVLAGQVHQESSWRPDAKSQFASGLAQFTPSTADWISRAFPDDLGANQPFNPEWALRALARYDKYLYDRQRIFATDCDRMAFALAGYNGGEGWVTRDKKLAQANGADPSKWWGHVEYFSARAEWAKRENRAYPRLILLQRQSMYRVWGIGVDCRFAS